MIQGTIALGWEGLGLSQVGIPDLVESLRKTLPSEERRGNGRGGLGVGQREAGELELVCKMKSNF